MIDITGNLVHDGRPENGRDRLKAWLEKNKLYVAEWQLDNPLMMVRTNLYSTKSNKGVH